MDKSDALRWNEILEHDARLAFVEEFRIRTLAELESPEKCIIRNMYFEEVRLFRCYAGYFSFELEDGRSIILREGEALVIYPGHRVTIEAKARQNRILYGVFDGRSAVEYFDALGFFDLAQGFTHPQYESMGELKRRIECECQQGENAAPSALSFLTDILVSIVRDLRSGSSALVFDAVRKVRENLKNRIVRIEPLCRDLGVSRSRLTQSFKQVGILPPAEFIRKEQERLAVSLLVNTRLTIAEIAERTGFISVPHFTTFIKNRTGQTPHIIRLAHA